MTKFIIQQWSKGKLIKTLEVGVDKVNLKGLYSFIMQGNKVVFNTNQGVFEYEGVDDSQLRVRRRLLETLVAKNKATDAQRRELGVITLKGGSRKQAATEMWAKYELLNAVEQEAYVGEDIHSMYVRLDKHPDYAIYYRNFNMYAQALGWRTQYPVERSVNTVENWNVYPVLYGEKGAYEALPSASTEMFYSYTTKPKREGEFPCIVETVPGVKSKVKLSPKSFYKNLRIEDFRTIIEFNQYLSTLEDYIAATIPGYEALPSWEQDAVFAEALAEYYEPGWANCSFCNLPVRTEGSYENRACQYCNEPIQNYVCTDAYYDDSYIAGEEEDSYLTDIEEEVEEEF